MKSSQYNLYLQSAHPAATVVYNTLTGSLYTMPNSVKEAIESGDVQSLDPEQTRSLLNDAVIVPDGFDETTMFRVKRDRLKYSSGILRLVLLPTYQCNLRCSYCYVQAMTKGILPSGSMNRDHVEAIVGFVKRKALERRFDGVSLEFNGGGEPTLKSDIIHEIISRLTAALDSDLALSPTIVTNGTLLTQDLVRSFQEFNMKYQLTLDGHKPRHDNRRIRKDNSGTYYEILGSLALLEKSRVTYKVRIHVEAGMENDLEELLEDLKSRIGSGISVDFRPVLFGEESAWPCDLSCSARDKPSVMLTAWELAAAKGFKPAVPPMLRLLPCKAMADDQYVINPFGDVHKCEAIAHDEQFRIGALSSSGKLIHLEPHYYDWMTLDPLDEPHCRKCSVLPACGGGCPAVAYSRRKTGFPGSCTRSKELTIYAITFQLKRLFPELFGTSESQDQKEAMGHGKFNKLFSGNGGIRPKVS